MINLLLKKLENVSMSKGRFLADKSYKYDTIYFVTKYLYEFINSDLIDLSLANQLIVINRIVETFSLKQEESDSNKNYLLETLGFLEYTGAIKKLNQTQYKINDIFQLDFITISCENAYIYQYLVAYKTFVNDKIWDLYLRYLYATDKSLKENLLLEIKEKICSLSSSIGDPNSIWALNVVKFVIMVLGLANSDNVVTRGLKIKDEIIDPEKLSANVEGTRSIKSKNNFYIQNFKLNYVKECLKSTSLNLLSNKITVDENKRLKFGTNIILYGVPGAGKSWTIEHYYKDADTAMERVVFHPDYTYSDFVGQILPKSVNGNVTYEFIPGPFTKIMNEAYHNPQKKYILVIEEINRGNAPAIFGDIFQLLDRNLEKQCSAYKITNADIAKVIYGDETHKVAIPSNLSLICTMNTSDQNVFTLDTAFQRRWNMRLIENTFKKDTKEDKQFAETKILDSNITWEAFCDAINEQILDKNQNMTSSEDKRLGTHFVTTQDLIFDSNDGIDAELNNRKFPEKVIKYLWDDAFKFYRDEIFKPDYNSLEKLIKAYTTQNGDDRFNIFKDNIRASIEEKNKEIEEKNKKQG